jgi:hypothetical protein
VPSGSIISNSFGGPVLDVKYHIANPFRIILHGGVGLPYKTSSTTVSGNPTASLPSDFGDGFVNGTSVHGGVGTIFDVFSLKASLNLNDVYTVPSAQDVTDAPPGTPQVNVQNGNRVSLSEGLAWIFAKKYSFIGGFLQSWVDSMTVNGDLVAGSASRYFASRLGFSTSVSRAWKASVNYVTEYPFYNYEVNQTFGDSFGITFVYSEPPDPASVPVAPKNIPYHPTNQ